MNKKALKQFANELRKAASGAFREAGNPPVYVLPFEDAAAMLQIPVEKIQGYLPPEIENKIIEILKAKAAADGLDVSNAGEFGGLGRISGQGFDLEI